MAKIPLKKCEKTAKKARKSIKKQVFFRAVLFCLRFLHIYKPKCIIISGILMMKYKNGDEKVIL